MRIIGSRHLKVVLVRFFLCAMPRQTKSNYIWAQEPPHIHAFPYRASHIFCNKSDKFVFMVFIFFSSLFVYISIAWLTLINLNESSAYNLRMWFTEIPCLMAFHFLFILQNHKKTLKKKMRKKFIIFACWHRTENEIWKKKTHENSRNQEDPIHERKKKITNLMGVFSWNNERSSVYPTIHAFF